MGKRAETAQWSEDLDAPTFAEAARWPSLVDEEVTGGGDEGPAPLDRLDRPDTMGRLLDEEDWPTQRGPDGASARSAEDDEFAGIFEGLGPRESSEPPERESVTRGVKERGSGKRTKAPTAETRAASPAPKRLARPTSGNRTAAARRQESVWDAVEEGYRTEGHWGDLVEMYLQRVEGTGDLSVKGELFCRIGQVLRDELEDPQQALDAFVEALLLDPTDASAVEGVEGIARARGWWAELLAALQKELGNVEGRAREVAVCEHALRWARDEMHSPGRAEGFLDRIRQLDPGHPAIHLRLAGMYGDHGNWASQRDALERALEGARTGAQRSALHVALGELLEQKLNDRTQATAHFEAALNEDPHALPALEGLERICRASDRFVELVQVLEQQVDAAQTDAQRVAALVRLAEVHEERFVQPHQAIPSLEEALRIDPSHVGALGALERCYLATRSWPDLVRTLDLQAQAAGSTAERADVLVRMAEVIELQLGDLPAATLVWMRIWDDAPSNERALWELARLAERSEDWTAAAAYRSKLADVAPTPEASARIHLTIAEMLSASGRDAKLARVHYERAATLFPAATEAWEALERDARKNGDLRRTAMFLEKRAASTEAPRTKAQLFVELAALHLQQGDEPAAELAYERAVKADPKNLVAADAMLAAHVREARWADAQPLCTVLLEARDDRGSALGAARSAPDGDPARVAYLSRLATRIATELGQVERALPAAVDAYRAHPSLDAAQDLVEACVACLGDPGVLAPYAAELAAVAAGSYDLPLEAIGRLARVRQAQGGDEDAIALFARVLDHHEEDRDALRGLSELMAARGDWERAASYKQKLGHAVRDVEEQFALLVEAGETWMRHAQNLPMAALAYEEALARKPRDHGVLHTLMWLYGELSCWEKLVETLRTVADLHTDRSARAKSVYAMAMVVRDHLRDLPRTAKLLEEVLDLDPTRLDAFERIVRVHTELRDWVELKHAYGRMLRRLKADGNLELKHALFFQLGLIYRDRLGDAARALDAFRGAQRVKPDADDVRKGMIELYVVTDQLDEGVKMVRGALKKRPLDAKLYAELYELFLRKRSFDQAWCAVDALATLGVTLDEERGRFYADYPPPSLSTVPGTLATTAWRSHIVHEGLDPALSSIFALVTPAVLRARTSLIPFQQLRASLGEPLQMNGALAHEVLQTLADASEILNVSAPSLHPRKQPVPFALAPAKNALYVSLEACDALPADALAFLVGKRLAEQRPELMARAACPTVSELKGLVHIAVQLSEPSLLAPNTGNAAFDKALAQAISREERAALRAAVSAAKAQGSELDVSRWSKLAEVSAARVGLLLGGRIDAARRGMLGDAQVAGDLLPKQMLAELLAFSVSEEYADMRQAIGVGVTSNAAA
ncbi:MAG TPA: hypothetical protein VGI39_44300 [Polyangiaceae bacterium]